MPHNMIILYFRLPCFHVWNSVLFSTLYFCTLILQKRCLDTFYGNSFIYLRELRTSNTERIQNFAQCYHWFPWNGLMCREDPGWSYEHIMCFSFNEVSSVQGYRDQNDMIIFRISMGQWVEIMMLISGRNSNGSGGKCKNGLCFPWTTGEWRYNTLCWW